MSINEVNSDGKHIENNSINSSYNEQTEISEVDTVNKHQQDFDEMISFRHAYLNYRYVRCYTSSEKLKEMTFNLLLTDAFFYSGSIIDIKSMVNVTNKDAVKNIREKIKEYKDYDLQQKMQFLENTPFYAKTLGCHETAELLLPLLSELPKGKDVYKEKFFSSYPRFVEEINKFGKKAYTLLKDKLVNLIREVLANTKDQSTLKLVGDGLVFMTKTMEEEDKGNIILPVVIGMAQEEGDNEKKEIAMKLFGKLAPLVGSLFVQMYIIPQVASFVNESSPKIRKEVASQLVTIFEIANIKDFKRRLFPIYKTLASDSNLTVKKTTVEILPKIAKFLEKDNISKEILPIYYNFAKDEKQQVKNAALEIYGEFLTLLNQNKEEDYSELLNFYVNSINELNSSKKEIKLIIQKCAYNFPAVLQFFGAKSWEKLKPCFSKLANEKDEKIKLPIAASLGEIANILGNNLTESDLLDYVQLFWKTSSQNSQLKIKVLTILPEIIKRIPSNKKNTYLEYIKLMIGNKEDKWRKRIVFCKLIGKFNGTYNDSIIYKRVFPIAINFCFDDISQVRSTSARKNSRLIMQLISSKTEYKDKTMKIIRSFAQSINFRYRELFIYMCKHFFDDIEVFNENTSELLLDLAYDKIDNVRVILIQYIHDLIKKEKYKHLSKNETIRKIVTVLRNDQLQDIKDILVDMDEVENIEVELTKEVNQKFTDNMNFVSNEFGITRNVPLNAKIMERKNEESPETKEEKGETESKIENNEEEEKKNIEENKIEEDNKNDKTEENKSDENKTEEEKNKENKNENEENKNENEENKKEDDKKEDNSNE